MERILITGGCGFIGTNIALEAKWQGYEVVSFDSLVRNKGEENLPVLLSAGVEIIRGDVRNQDDFKRIPRPDHIIHLAANPGIPWSIANPSYDFDVNARGTLNVLEYAREVKAAVVYASTNKVYSDLLNELVELTEDNPTRYPWKVNKRGHRLGLTDLGVSEKFTIDGQEKYPHSPYGVSKLTGDVYCQEYFHIYNLPVVINRMSCIFGNYQKGVTDQGWIDHFIRVIGFGDGRLEIFGNGKQVRDMLWGGDVAKLYLKEVADISKVAGSVFNVGGGMENTMSLLEAIKFLEELIGRKAELTFHDWRMADQKIYISDIRKVSDKLDWKPTISPQQGIDIIYRNYQSGSSQF